MFEVAKSFQRSLERLTAAEQAIVRQVPYEYMVDPARPGLSLHRIDKARDKRLWTIRADRDLRIVVFKDGARSAFLYVGQHDDAYRWGETHQLEVHPVTGAAQIVEIAEVVREEVRVITRTIETAAPLPPAKFANEDDGYLLALGVPQVYLDAVRSVRVDDDLVSLLDRLPEEAAEALIELGEGRRPAPALRVIPTAHTDPFAHPDARRRFWTTSDQAELTRALEMPWAEWLVFLHPSQRLAVERIYGGPARVAGSAGTGKSVVAMHRAARLAEASHENRVFLTTYSRILASRLSAGMDALLGVGSSSRRRVEVMALHEYIMGHASRIEKPSVADGPFLEHQLREAGRGLESSFDYTFLRSEWDRVIDFWGLSSLEGYRDIQRTGRGTSLSPRQRRELWEVFAKVRAGLERAGMMTWGDVADRMRARIEGDGQHPFDHVVVDEAQDLGPRELRLAAALAAQPAQGVFFAGDIGQRIFQWPFSWLSAGVDVRGRAQRLKVNYRTSAEIKRFSDRLLPGQVLEPDGDADPRDAVSVLHGPDPELRGAPTIESEISQLKEWVEDLLTGDMRPSEIAVLGRVQSAVKSRALPALRELGIASLWLSAEADVESGKVNLLNLQAAKGLEFRAVAIVGCDDTQVPLASALSSETDSESRRAIEERERSLFYVGCTRARDRLLITWSGEPSRFIADWLGQR